MSESNHQPALSKEQIDSVIALYSNGQYQEAIDTIILLTKNYPESSLLNNIAGACYVGLGQLGSAVQSYEKAISIDPEYSKAYFNLGNVLHELSIQGLGHLDDPISSFERSIGIDPNFAEAHNNLGNALSEYGRVDLSIKNYEKKSTH